MYYAMVQDTNENNISNLPKKNLSFTISIKLGYLFIIIIIIIFSSYKRNFFLVTIFYVSHYPNTLFSSLYKPHSSNSHPNQLLHFPSLFLFLEPSNPKPHFPSLRPQFHLQHHSNIPIFLHSPTILALAQ